MEAMGTLTGGISHEFNNILTTVYGSAEILKDVMNSDDPLKKYVVAIYDSAQRAIDLTKGLLTYSRRQTTNVHSISLNDTIKKWESFIAKLIGPDLTFRVDLPENKIIVRADENQLQQVLVNVAANARDAMPDGGALIISLALFEMDNDYIKSRGFGKRGMYALLKVKDTGTGMTPKIREKVFEPFFTTKDVGRGTGLGLSIVYGIIKNHFGYIEVESIPGSGTTFLIYLPLVEESTPSSTSASV